MTYQLGERVRVYGKWSKYLGEVIAVSDDGETALIQAFTHNERSFTITVDSPG